MTAQRLLLFLTAGALATGGSLYAAGAAQAKSDPLTYSCATVLGPAASAVATDTNLPDVMYVGDSQPVGLTSAVTVPWDGAISLAYGLLAARSAQGTATALGTITGPGGYNVPTTTNLTVPQTAIANNTPLTIASSGVGAAFAPKAPGVYTVTAGDFTSVLNFLKEDGTDTGLGPQTIPCTAPAGVSRVVDTVTVKARTQTAATVKGARLHRAPKAKVAVTSVAGVPTGQVALVLKKGSRTVQHKTVTLKNGRAVVHLKRIAAKGRYTLTVTYAGTGDLVGSAVVERFRVH
jgi:Family of unknown function (DUF6801)